MHSHSHHSLRLRMRRLLPGWRISVLNNWPHFHLNTSIRSHNFFSYKLPRVRFRLHPLLGGRKVALGQVKLQARRTTSSSLTARLGVAVSVVAVGDIRVIVVGTLVSPEVVGVAVGVAVKGVVVRMVDGAGGDVAEGSGIEPLEWHCIYYSVT